MSNAHIRILIVEDNPLLALAMRDMVEDMGYGVVGPLLNFRDGLDYAKISDVQFALLDFDLGNCKTAAPIAETLAARGVPFVFISGTDASVIRAAFVRAIVIAKPVAPRDLARVLPT